MKEDSVSSSTDTPDRSSSSSQEPAPVNVPLSSTVRKGASRDNSVVIKERTLVNGRQQVFDVFAALDGTSNTVSSAIAAPDENDDRAMASNATTSSSSNGPQHENNAESTNANTTTPRKSAIHYVTSADGQRMRQGHLSVLLPLSRDVPDRKPIEFRVYVELSAFLAFQHLQHKSGLVLPDVQRRIQDCDFRMTYQHYDTLFSPIQAVKGLMLSHGILREGSWSSELPTRATVGVQGSHVLNSNSTNHHHSGASSHDDPNHQPSQQLYYHNDPFALVGSARSVVSETLAVLGGGMDLPQISPSSTSSALNHMELFARTIPTNAVDAHAIMAYLHHLEVEQIGILFARDTWGRNFQKELQRYSQQYNITTHSVAYVDPDDLPVAMEQLERTLVHYFVGVVYPNDWRKVLKEAHKRGLAGNAEHQWFLGDIAELSGGTVVVEDADLVQALQGVGVVALKVLPHLAFDRALKSLFHNPQLQQEFIQAHAEPHLFDDYEFNLFPGRSIYQYLAYDAVIALGLTACETPGLFTGQEFYQNLVQMDFMGVTGRVQFSNKTGTRLGEAMEYEVVNLVLMNDQNQSATANASRTQFYFDARTSNTIDLSPLLYKTNDTAKITESNPFLYYGNTTIMPMVLPPAIVDMNLVPEGIRYFGLILAGLVMALSVACAVWSCVSRKLYVVKAAQPVFLIQICVGTFILASAVIPLSFQEDMPGLDEACLSLPWLISLGFTTAVAALHAKAHRINKLMNLGGRRQKQSSFRRVTVSPSDVIWPFFIMCHTTVMFLLAWTASPFRLVWERVPTEGTDVLGRPTSTYGHCSPADGTNWYIMFAIPLFGVNLLVLVRATIASYRGRVLPTAFAETKYLTVALVSLCETCVLGVPLLAVLQEPTAFFLVSSLVICIGCLAILIPVFLPKWLSRHAEEPKGRKAHKLFERDKFKWSLRRSSKRIKKDKPLPSGFLDTLQQDFLETQPQKIKRVSEATTTTHNSSTTTAAASRISSSSFADQLPRPSAVYNNLASTGGAIASKGGAIAFKGGAIVSKAILLATPHISSHESSTAAESSQPSRLETLREVSSANETNTELDDDGTMGRSSANQTITEIENDTELDEDGTMGHSSANQTITDFDDESGTSTGQ